MGSAGREGAQTRLENWILSAARQSVWREFLARPLGGVPCREGGTRLLIQRLQNVGRERAIDSKGGTLDMRRRGGREGMKQVESEAAACLGLGIEKG